MNAEVIKAKLIHAITEYDRKQSKRKGYNPYALGIYFQRADDVCADIESGKTPRQALLGGFNDRLLDVCLAAIGEPKFTREEMLRQPLTYSPTDN